MQYMVTNQILYWREDNFYRGHLFDQLTNWKMTSKLDKSNVTMLNLLKFLDCYVRDYPYSWEIQTKVLMNIVYFSSYSGFKKCSLSSILFSV